MYRRPPRETKPQGKISPIWFVVIGASVILSAALLIIRPSPKFLRREITPIALPIEEDSMREEAKPAPIPPASNPRSGMGIARRDVVGALSVKPYHFRFRDGRPIDDESNYLGFSYALPRASVQILGRSDDIAEAAYNDVILPDSVWKVAAGSTAMAFVRVIDRDAMPWLAENFKKVSANKSCFATKTIGGRTWTLSYSQFGPEGHFLIRASVPKSNEAATR